MSSYKKPIFRRTVCLVGLVDAYYKHIWTLNQLRDVVGIAYALASGVRVLRQASSPPPRKLLRLSTEQIAEMAELYKRGASTYDLAKQFGIRRDRASQLLRQAGVRTRPGNMPKLDEHMKERARELRLSGLSIRKIAIQLRVSDNTVMKALI